MVVHSGMDDCFDKSKHTASKLSTGSVIDGGFETEKSFYVLRRRFSFMFSLL